MINILVTGANGQLGRSIKEVAKNLHQYNFIFKDSKSLDVTSENQVFDFFETTNLDYCINCAGYTAVDNAEIEEDLCFSVNADAVSIIAKACLNKNCILIHISTDYVFDGSKKQPYLENDLTNPLNIYGKSKLKGERWVKQHLNKYFIIRTSWLYSKHGNNFVKTILKLGRQTKELKVISDQYGSPTNATDLSRFIINIIDQKIDLFGVYHYSNSGAISWFDFAKSIITLSNSKSLIHPSKTNDFPLKAKRPSYSVLNIEKANNLFSKPIENWKDSLSKYIKNMP